MGQEERGTIYQVDCFMPFLIRFFLRAELRSGFHFKEIQVNRIPSVKKYYQLWAYASQAQEKPEGPGTPYTWASSTYHSRDKEDRKGHAS